MSVDSSSQAQIDADHGALAELIDAMAQICAHAPEDSHCLCGDCPAAKRANCEDSLSCNVERMLHLMLAHFTREDVLMHALPRTVAIQHHCEEHRNSHHEFSLRYNHLVAAASHETVGTQIRAWMNFVLDWSRRHALEYDAKLSELAQRANGG